MYYVSPTYSSDVFKIYKIIFKGRNIWFETTVDSTPSAKKSKEKLQRQKEKYKTEYNV